MRKKWLYTGVIAGMAFLTACGGKSSADGQGAEQAQTEQTQTEQASQQETEEEAPEDADKETCIKKADAAYEKEDYDKAAEYYYRAAKMDFEKNVNPDSEQSFWQSDAYDDMLECLDESKDQNKVYEYAKE